MVDWKKEYKVSEVFKRQKADESGPEADPAEAEAQSVWKKEIKLFGGKKKQQPVEPEPAAEQAQAPWYKKEVSLKRAKRAETPDEPAVEASAESPQVPWYKKEVSLRRKPAAQPPVRASGPVEGIRGNREVPSANELEPVMPEPVTPAATEPVSVRPEPVAEPIAEAAPERDAEPLAPEPVAETQPGLAVAAVPVPGQTPEPVVPEPVAEAEPAPESELVLPEPEPAQPLSWIDAVLEEPAAQPPVRDGGPVEAPAATEPEPLEELPSTAQQPVRASGLVEVEPEPTAAPPAPPPVEQEAPVADPGPIHPPVAADELPPLEEWEEPKPWYKRELSFGRKAKATAKPPVRGGPDPAKPVPFWKKELTFTVGRKAAAAATRTPKPAPEPAAVAPPATKPLPFWKKELSLGRRAKAPAEAPPSAPKPKQAAQPFWKRELALPGLPTLPQRGGGGRGQTPKQLVGLKIGASQLAAARVSNNAHAEVVQVAREPLDQGIVVGGELRDPEALAVALKEFFGRNKLPKRGVRLGIANNRIGVRTFEITGIDDPKQLANAIRFRAQEALPIPIEEAVLDYQVLDEGVNDEGERVRKILLVVAYRELVDRYVSACRKAGITLVGVDLEAFALLRALAAPREEDGQADAALVAVAVGHDRSTFAVSDGRVCEFTRVLEWGGQNLNVAIARALDLSPSEAEPIKHVLSLGSGPAPDGLSEEQAAAVREAVMRQVNTFARELVSSLQFYQSQPNSLGIGEIVLTGGTAHLIGFAAELQRLIGVKVRIGDPLVRVKVSKRFREPEQVGSLAVAIGLGIED